METYIIRVNGEEFEVNAGEAFIILPDEITFYQADKNEPWVYRWVGFNGALSQKYKELPPVVPISNDIFPNIEQDQTDMQLIEFMLAGQLFTMTAALLSKTKHKHHYVRQVKNYINAHYMEQISVDKISKYLGLDRRYLVRLFKGKTGQTLQDYIISVRMEEARRLLSLGRSVNEAASLCGYNDTCNFSKMFKKHFGSSPANWKSQG